MKDRQSITIETSSGIGIVIRSGACRLPRHRAGNTAAATINATAAKQQREQERPPA